jgi:hypothetical protein
VIPNDLLLKRKTRGSQWNCVDTSFNSTRFSQCQATRIKEKKWRHGERSFSAAQISCKCSGGIRYLRIYKNK